MSAAAAAAQRLNNTLQLMRLLSHMHTTTRLLKNLSSTFLIWCIASHCYLCCCCYGNATKAGNALNEEYFSKWLYTSAKCEGLITKCIFFYVANGSFLVKRSDIFVLCGPRWCWKVLTHTTVEVHKNVNSKQYTCSPFTFFYFCSYLKLPRNLIVCSASRLRRRRQLRIKRIKKNGENKGRKKVERYDL